MEIFTIENPMVMTNIGTCIHKKNKLTLIVTNKLRMMLDSNNGQMDLKVIWRRLLMIIGETHGSVLDNGKSITSMLMLKYGLFNLELL